MPFPGLYQNGGDDAYLQTKSIAPSPGRKGINPQAVKESRITRPVMDTSWAHFAECRGRSTRPESQFFTAIPVIPMIQ
jgi:hypothetical protein